MHQLTTDQIHLLICLAEAGLQQYRDDQKTVATEDDVLDEDVYVFESERSISILKTEHARRAAEDKVAQLQKELNYARSERDRLLNMRAGVKPGNNS